MEKEFAEALRALPDEGVPGQVWMIGPNAMILGIVAVIGIVIIAMILSRANLKFSFGKVMTQVGKAGEETSVRLDDLLGRIKKIELDVLRLNLISEENPLEERARAGWEYVKNGGNGAAQAEYEKLRKRLERKTGRRERA